MARSSKAAAGVRTIQRPAKFETFNDPDILTANAAAETQKFRDTLHRSRKAGGHDDAALNGDRTVYGFEPPRQQGLINQDGD
ncbi:hypothetical protein IVB14_12955 [Bradyrhizobium sp. 180]|uniref:hypothetical protein n=1 Tax=Bradyrhizobium sp. 180 TaxID=2782650 RepID=UPI001FFBD49D|nr:hypothetical protein [Bradyrhizobium sp. 180]MCK1491300.1 hypothetical protein [Bradyrhizobium sp. 180]